MSMRHHTVRTASALLLGTIMLAGTPAPVSLARSGTTCRVRNVTQDTHGGSFRRMVAASRDGDRLRVRGTCTSSGVVIDKDLTIRGIGGGATLQAHFESAHRVLRVTEGASVTLRNLIVQGGWLDCSPGSCRPVKGAGILNQGRLTLRRVVVQGNGGLGVTGLGIWNGGTLILRRSVVRRNWEQDGGEAAIVNRGTMTLRHSRVRHNDGKAGILNSGVARLFDSVVAEHQHRVGDIYHGIYNSGTLTLIRSDIRANKTVDSGGGIWNGGTLTVVDSVIRNNSSDGVGGGIWNGGTLTVVDTVIRNNYAEEGSGGGLWNASGPGSTAVIRGSRIVGNRSYGAGGGIGNLGGLTLVDTVVRGNRSSEAGGGIYNGGLYGDPLGTLAIDAASSVTGNAPDDCVGTPAC